MKNKVQGSVSHAVRTILTACGVLAVASTGFADTVEVTETAKVVANGDGWTVTPSTYRQTGYPTAVGEPQFWFDCTRTNGWEIAADGKVSKVTSLVGSRYLTTQKTTGGWNGWGGTSPMGGASYVAQDDLGGKPALDFGPFGGTAGFLFNATEEGGPNVLHDIGTVVAVWGSHNGGGWIFSGGYGNGTGGSSSGIAWHRKAEERTGKESKVVYYDNGLSHGAAGSPFYNGLARHDGNPSYVRVVGMNGGWETLSIVCTNDQMEATGIGFNDGRSSDRQGGMKIAELMVFDRRLTNDECRKLEIYLSEKWMGRENRGVNGNANLGRVRVYSNSTTSSLTGGDSLSVETPAAEKLTIGGVQGGRHAKAKIVKSGAGTLAVGDVSDYNGEVVLSGGTLDMGRRQTPSTYPAGVVFHLDASAEDSIVLDEGTNTVKAWRSLESLAWKGNRVCCARRAEDGRRMTLKRDAFGPGRHVVDFGKFRSPGAYFRLYTNETATATAELPGITTVVGIIGAQGGGGHLVGNSNEQAVMGLRRGAQEPNGHEVAMIKTNTVLDFQSVGTMPVEAVAYVNGVRHPQTDGYPSPGFQTVAFQSIGNTVQVIGSFSVSYYYGGGMQIGELLLYNRMLTDRELEDAQAYLYRKWFGRDMPGYVSGEPEVPDVQKVTVEAPTDIVVPAGQTVRIGRLTANAKLVKRGAGTLELGALDGTSVVDVSEGRVVSARAADVASACEVAKGASLHLDASDTNRMDFVRDAEGNRYVTFWHDRSNRTVAYVEEASKYGTADSTRISRAPKLDVVNTLGGKPVLDFGTMGGGGKYMVLQKGMDSIRSVFMVWDGSGGGFLLGSGGSDFGANNSLFDFHRGMVDGKFVSESPLIYENGTLGHVHNGVFYTNGVAVAGNGSSIIPPNGFFLVEIHTTAGAHASALAEDRGNTGDRRGGQRIAEAIVYERELTERERVATRNYLMKKWFGKTDSELTPLPPQPELPALDRLAFHVEAGESLAVGENGDIGAKEVSGEGAIVKNGDTTFSVALLDGFSGVVQVNAGTLRLAALAAPALPEDAPSMWLDARRNLVTHTFGTTPNVVESWTSVSGDGRQALPKKYVDSYMTPPTFLAEGFNGQPCVDFTRGEYFRFGDADGNMIRLTDIGSVFWVIGSKTGGGYLLGDSTAAGGNTAAPTFARAKGTSFPGDLCTVPLLADNAQAEVKAADWRVNAAAVDPLQTGLSGDWDVVSMTLRPDAAKKTSADGLAYTGGHQDNQWNCGFQQLAELLIYDRILTADERDGVESYLANRWGLPAGDYESAFTNSFKAILAKDATLDCNGRTRYLSVLAGSGTVEGDVVLGGLVADGAATDWMTVNGKVTVETGAKIELRNLDRVPAGVNFVRILAAESVEGYRNDVTFVGENLPTGLRLRVRKGYLGVDLSTPGLMVIVK